MAWQVGDGTTTVVILAGELLRECKAFVEEGVHPQVRPLQPWSLLVSAMTTKPTHAMHHWSMAWGVPV